MTPPFLRFSISLSLLSLLCLLLSACRHSNPEFYPLGIYSVSTAEDLDIIAEAGFNLVRGSADQEFLDAAQARGIRVLAYPHTSAGPKFDAAAARRAIKQFDAHPALWAWYLVDEPDLHAVPPESVRDSQRFLKNLPARKPTALVIYQGARALDYANITDILMIDRYPIPWLPLANFPQHVRMARLALGKDKPLIAVIQAFDWSYYPDLMPDEQNLRPPSYEELRCMTYLALAQRANGLFFYCYNDSRWNIREHPETWHALREVVREVKERQPLFAAEHLWWPHSHQFDDHENRFNAALESSITPVLLRVRAGNGTIPAGDYILAVNNTPIPHAYRVRPPWNLQRPVPVVGEDRWLLIEDDRLEDHFEPFAIHIYGPLE
jgi:hypothetical protein